MILTKCYSIALFTILAPVASFANHESIVFKLSSPNVPTRPKLMFLESPDFNLLAYHGEGEPSNEGSLIIGFYKNDPSTPSSPIDIWLTGRIQRRQGELCNLHLGRYIKDADDLVLMVFLKHRSMLNCSVYLYRQDEHLLIPLKEVEDVHGKAPVESVREICERDGRISKYFVESKK